MGIRQVMECFKQGRKEKILLFLSFLIVLGCSNINTIAQYPNYNTYSSLIQNAISLYIKRNNLLNKKEADYYKCYDKIIYGKSFLDPIKFSVEIPCKTDFKWQEKVAFIEDKAIRIDIFLKNNVYKDSIYLDNKNRYLGRYYGFNNTFSYHLIAKDKNYYDSFSSISGSDSFTISRFYNKEDMSLHPSSDSYEAEIERDEALKRRKERYTKLAKYFLTKNMDIHNKNVAIDKVNKTYTVYRKINNNLLRIHCILEEGKCLISTIKRI